MEAMLYRLLIDPEFLGLIPPMQRKEYIQLEMNIREDGCRDPIVVWEQTIVDGHNRYQICHKNKIPFKIVHKEFESREDAKAWICANQLGRRNITPEYRKYLIGMQYDLEKCVQRKRTGRNQYSPARIIVNQDGEIGPLETNLHVTARSIGEQHNISEDTVQKYARFSRAINKINETAPEVGPRVLDGTIKVSHEGVMQMAKMDSDQLSEFAGSFSSAKHPVITYDPSRCELVAKENPKSKEAISSGPTVKDMPEYDPDAAVAGLTLTIPSWIKVIEHTKNKADFNEITEKAKARLDSELHNLVDAASMLLKVLVEG